MYGCLFIFIFGAFFILLSGGLSLLRALFGVHRAARRFMNPDAEAFRRNAAEQQKRAQAGKRQAEKKNERHFAKDEGEYVDFEEVK